uniref:Cytosolic arginine sensor for mTORC1 subunit 1 n=1 Tax=Cyprinus carpio TaxID=7962 RepID=A0A8C1PNE6_CYPCA
MDLHILDHKLRVTSISKTGLQQYTHPLIKLIFLRNRTRCKFFSLTETPENYTVVLDEEGFKELQPSEHLQVEGSTWLPLNVVSNGNTSSSSQAVGVTKIAKSVIAPLAEQHVSVFMLSTYQTDFILVREKDLSVVVETLVEEFNIFREEGGESVPVHSQDACNGLQRNVHPVLIPENQFCVMSLDPDTLPAIATTLIDVLFYSNRYETFYHTLGERWGELSRFYTILNKHIRLNQKVTSLPLILTLSHSLCLFFFSDECGIVAQISQPLADSDISAYYISTFSFDHALVSHFVSLGFVKQLQVVVDEK